MLDSLAELLIRDLSKMQEEIGLYKDESLLWETSEGISNSAGNLALHVAGNLQHFIGATLGNSGYVRQRELEFSSKNVPAEQLISELEKAKLAVRTTLSNLNVAELKKPFPIDVFKQGMSTEMFLLHLLTHTSYHLGQINYHRRILATS